ncbi:GHKL domain-containing protein [Clostridium estertheticum]|uniref:sensor histidine kinase n=1 Tax=Clostridium estertheticum TaxID=238834 RepID=UPI001C6E5D76|nr:GHKL domain-containing protein [Clostridium estertheticum]MBW9154624.1 GHKL domain-containing protein [Clostridium estertheticum]WLC86534.1 GHKL domain-containing protein [Clostridium estertheticum]
MNTAKGMMTNMIMNLLYIFIITLNFGTIMVNLSYIKITIKSFLIIESILFIVTVFINNYNLDELIVPIITIIMIIYIYMLFKKIYYALSISIFIQLIFAFGDTIAGGILVFIFKLKYSNILFNPKIKLITSLLILTLCYFISKYSRNLLKNNHIKNLFNVKLKINYFLAGYIIISFISVYFYILLLKMRFNNPSKILILVTIFLISSYFIMMLILIFTNSEHIKENLELEYKENELHQLKEYTFNLENLSDDLRNFRHDQMNIFQTIGEYIKSENIKDLKKFYYTELMPQSKIILEKNYSYTLLKHIKIDPLKGLVSSKIIKAQSKNIKVKIEIVDDVNELSINLIDICRIIGNLLDNAIEGAILCDNKFIGFLVYKNKNSTTFIISNSCLEKTLPIYKIYEKNFSTKGENRGRGLKYIKYILDSKYVNINLNTVINNSIFTQELIIVNN